MERKYKIPGMETLTGILLFSVAIMVESKYERSRSEGGCGGSPYLE